MLGKTVPTDTKCPRAMRGYSEPARLTAIGVAALAMGLVVYATDRAATGSAPFPAIAIAGGLVVFGLLGQWLPSFVHPFAFSLFTAAARSPAAAPAYGACAAWWAVDVAFEVGQHPHISTALAKSLQHVLGPTVPVRWLSNYFVRGTFDTGDLVAATAGALAAAGIIYLVHRMEARHAQ
jgi:hypothetical protein